MPLQDSCGCCMSTLDSSWVHYLLVHGHGGVGLIDQAVGPAPSYKKLYSYSTVEIRELYDLDFCGLGVLVLGAALHAGRRRLHAVQLHLGLHRETITVGGGEVCGLGWVL